MRPADRIVYADTPGKVDMRKRASGHGCGGCGGFALSGSVVFFAAAAFGTMVLAKKKEKQ